MRRYKCILLCFYFSICLVIFTSCGSSDIETVKNGYLPFDRGITFGSAVENYKYFESTKWKKLKTKKGREIVQINGKLKKDYFITGQKDKALIEQAEMIIQCSINKDDQSFDVMYTGVELKTKCDKAIKSFPGDWNWVNEIYHDQRNNIEWIYSHLNLCADQYYSAADQ